MRISDWSSDVCSSDLVGLQGYLGAGGKAPERSDLLQRGGHRFGRHQRRRAATEEDGADPAGAALCGGVLQVAQQRRPPARLVDALAHVAVEVAVGALRSRSEEHTSELQSLMRISYAVFCLKKKTPLETSTTPYLSRC